MDLVALNGVKGWEMAPSKVLPEQTLGHELRYLEPRQKPCMGHTSITTVLRQTETEYS